MNYKRLVLTGVFIFSIATNAIANRPIERSLLKRPIELVKKTVIAGIACASFAVAGCSPFHSKFMPEKSPVHKTTSWHKANHPEILVRNNSLWHVHHSNQFGQHGKTFELGLVHDEPTLESNAMFDDERTWTASDYDNVLVLYNSGEEITYGLAVADETSEQYVSILSPNNSETYLINIDKIEGIAFQHHPLYGQMRNREVTIHKDDILTAVDGYPYPDGFYVGELRCVFSNGMCVLGLRAKTQDGELTYFRKWQMVIVSEDFNNTTN